MIFMHPHPGIPRIRGLIISELPTVRELVDSANASAISRMPSDVVRNMRVKMARPEERSQIEPF